MDDLSLLTDGRRTPDSWRKSMSIESADYRHMGEVMQTIGISLLTVGVSSAAAAAAPVLTVGGTVDTKVV